MRNELKKRVEPKRQRTVYSKENAPTNSRVEQISVPQPIVSKSGRQIKISRRAQGSTSTSTYSRTSIYSITTCLVVVLGLSTSNIHHLMKQSEQIYVSLHLVFNIAK
jgi:hypothetical protein